MIFKKAHNFLKFFVVYFIISTNLNAQSIDNNLVCDLRFSGNLLDLSTLEYANIYPEGREIKYATGKYGFSESSADFLNSDSSIMVDPLGVNFKSTGYSYSILFKRINNKKDWEVLFDQGWGEGGKKNLSVTLNKENKLVISRDSSHRFTTDIEINKWYSLIISHDPQHIKFYINGDLIETQVWKLKDTSKLPISIGSVATKGESSFDEYKFEGLVDDFQIYDKPLNITEVKSILDQKRNELPHTDLDTDLDGLTDFEELKIYLTDPNNRDTDGDGYTDGDEVNIYKTNPRLNNISRITYENITSGLIGYYPFSGNTKDESGNGNHGKIYHFGDASNKSSAEFFNYDIFETGLSLNGTGFVKFANKYNINKDFTISIRYKIPKKIDRSKMTLIGNLSKVPGFELGIDQLGNKYILKLILSLGKKRKFLLKLIS